jgi:hypothetical protein
VGATVLPELPAAPHRSGAAEELWHVDLTIKQLTASLTGLTAAAGLIALIAATYERRLRDLRRLRDAVAHMQ